MTGQEIRNKLTDYWKEHGMQKGDEFALLTNVIHQEWRGLTVQKHKQVKGLKTHNLRDHMTDAELIFTALAELSTKQIAESDSAESLPQNIVAGKKGGKIAKDARLALEAKTGKKSAIRRKFSTSVTKEKNNSIAPNEPPAHLFRINPLPSSITRQLCSAWPSAGKS
jgi:hypothetical protein